MVEAVFSKDDIALVDTHTITDLKLCALKSAKRRFRACLHHDVGDLVQEMIIAFCRDTYVRPHRHPAVKSESYHIIDGKMDVFFFNEQGKPTRKIEMAPYGKGRVFVYRVSAGIWHMPVPCSDVVVFHETFTGPFDRVRDVVEAPWSPSENDFNAVAEFLRSVQEAKGIKTIAKDSDEETQKDGSV